MRLALCAVAAAAAAAAGSMRKRTASRDDIVANLHRATPSAEVDPVFDCAWREFAFEYAQQIQPFISDANLQAVFDGLALGVQCNQTFAGMPRLRKPAAAAVEVAAPAAAASTLYVDPAAGSDSNPGTLQQPLQHIAAAVTKARGLPRPASVILRGGVYQVTTTITLTAQDSGLSVTAYPGETPVVTGSMSLGALAWTPYNVSTGGGFAVFNNTNDVYGATPNGQSILNYTRTATWSDCQTLCAGYPGCTAFTWHDSVWPIEYNDTCWLRTDGFWSPTAEHDHVAGYRIAPQNIYAADVSGLNIPPLDFNTGVASLFTSTDGGATLARATRARFPNANPELDLWPIGWQDHNAGGTWLNADFNESSTTYLNITLPENAHAGEFADWLWGYALDDTSPCGKLTPNGSYWCQPNGRTQGHDYFVRQPMGFQYLPSLLPHAPYAPGQGPVGGIFNYWRGGHWFSLMGRISSYDPDNNTLLWDYGAFQGAEGEDTGEDWFIEHVMGELDAPNEFFYDAAAGKLYFYYNASTNVPPPPTTTFFLAVNPVIFDLEGTPEQPVTDITFSGITFTGTAASYMLPHGIPSGGDWALGRFGAILVEGAERVSISDCEFTRIEGNGVFLSGYSRNVSVDRCDFNWIGESAMVAWGKTDLVDGTAGTQPWYASMTNSICRQWGVYEKQTSCFFQAVTPLAYVANNIWFNGPRAAANINDNFGGGSLYEHNLMWNTCLESQDHGAMNSWGRVPYITTVRNGTASSTPAFNVVRSSFMVAGGGADGGSFDNDDGSNTYAIHDNFFVYGGFKSDFDGFSKQFYNNIAAYSYVYGNTCVNIMNLAPAGWGEGYYNNTCLLAPSSSYIIIGSGCNVSDPSSFTLTAGSNTVYSADSNVVVNCDGHNIAMSDWLTTGLDKGTTWQPTLPPAATIIQWARDLLA